jgi:hypothetical protein
MLPFMYVQGYYCASVPLATPNTSSLQGVLALTAKKKMLSHANVKRVRTVTSVGTLGNRSNYRTNQYKPSTNTHMHFGRLPLIS